MKSDLVSKLEDLERIRRRAARRTLVILISVVLLGCASAAAYIWSTQRKVEVARERVQEVTQEKQRVSEELSAQVQEETKRREESEKRIDETLNTIKDPAKAGIKAYHQGRYDEAIKAYDSSLKKDPNDFYIWNLKGYSLFKAGRDDEALTALRKSVEINPQYA